MKTVNKQSSEIKKQSISSRSEKTDSTAGNTITSVKDLAKEWSSFDPRVPLTFLLASKRAARMKNAF